MPLLPLPIFEIGAQLALDLGAEARPDALRAGLGGTVGTADEGALQGVPIRHVAGEHMARADGDGIEDQIESEHRASADLAHEFRAGTQAVIVLLLKFYVVVKKSDRTEHQEYKQRQP